MTKTIHGLGSVQEESYGDWVTPSLSAGWTGSYGFGYKKLTNGIVYIRGRLTPGTETDGTTIFTLPAGYRPVDATVNIITSNIVGSAGARLYINGSGGAVQIFGADTSGSIYDVNILFLAE